MKKCIMKGKIVPKGTGKPTGLKGKFIKKKRKKYKNTNKLRFA